MSWPNEPGIRWRRSMSPQYRVPSFRAFPSVKQGAGLWETIRWPDWGTLDRESFRALADILRRFSGPDTVAFAHPHFLQDPNADLRVIRGRLLDLQTFEQVDPYHCPANIWPADRSWLMFTDRDLSGTKVYGPPELLAMIEGDEFLETVWLPLSDGTPDEHR